MFAKIWAGIIAFLLWLFPFLSFLFPGTQPPPIQPLKPETVASNLMRAIEENDIDLFEEQLCLNIKVNVDDLPGKITELFDTIDGEVIELTWERLGGYEANRGGGKSLKQIMLHIYLTTTTENYILSGTLEFYNSFQPEEMGMRSILFGKYEPPYTPAVDIRATNGVGSWHE